MTPRVFAPSAPPAPPPYLHLVREAGAAVGAGPPPPPPHRPTGPPQPPAITRASAAGRPHWLERLPLRVVDALLWVTAVAGAVMLLMTAVLTAAGYRPLVVTSGSMEPAIPTGAVALVEAVDADTLEVGDVISVQTAGQPRIVHRIVAIDRQGSSVVATLKGDANDEADKQPVILKDAMKVRGTVPGLGWLAAGLRSPVAGFILGLLIVIPFAMRRKDRALHG